MFNSREIEMEEIIQFSARCHNIIEASSIVWEDKKFHESCFTCWGIDKDGLQCRKVRFMIYFQIHSLFVPVANER
jgi:hypothetical protein